MGPWVSCTHTTATTEPSWAHGSAAHTFTHSSHHRTILGPMGRLHSHTHTEIHTTLWQQPPQNPWAHGSAEHAHTQKPRCNTTQHFDIYMAHIRNIAHLQRRFWAWMWFWQFKIENPRKKQQLLSTNIYSTPSGPRSSQKWKGPKWC